MLGRVAVLKAYGGDFELRKYAVPDLEDAARRRRPAHLSRRRVDDRLTRTR